MASEKKRGKRRKSHGARGELWKLVRQFRRVELEVEKATHYEGRQLYLRARMLGPGLIAGAADDDAGGVSTYSIVGATTGFALSWLLLVSTPMLIAIQRSCALLGDVTKKGLATLVKEKFGKNVALFAAFALAVSNIAAIAANLAGMSVSLELVSGIKWYYSLIPLATAILYVTVYRSFRTIQKALIYLSLALLAYIVSGFLAKPDWGAALASTFIPKIEFSTAFLIAGVGLLGTTIAPYLFFWQTATEIEAKRTEKQRKKVDFDIFAGMFYSNLVSYFIMLSSAAMLYPRLQALGGLSALQNAADPVKFIAEALRPAAGDYSFYLFALGLFTASTLAIIVLSSSTAYVVSETLDWKRGLNKKVRQARGFYGVIVASVAAGIAVLLAGAKPIDAMFYSQVLAGIIDPILLFLIVKLASDRELMGQYAISGWIKWFAWTTFGVVTLFDLLLFSQIIFGG